MKDVNGRYVKPEGKVLVTFATDQSVENVYAVDPEGKLHTIEFEQRWKIILRLIILVLCDASDTPLTIHH